MGRWSMHDDVTIAARGRWLGILAGYGLSGRTLSGRHVPCPTCGGRDRFRFDDKEGRGTWICNECGAGDGFALLERVTGRGFADLAKEVREMVGSVEATQPRPELSEEDRKERLRALWKASQPVRQGDLVDVYLRSRGIDLRWFPPALRFCPECETDGKRFPAMLATVVGSDGKAVTMHRTFLAADGKGKASIEAPRKLMPGSLPDGACVRLSDKVPKELGIAEGIETALSVSMLFRIPCWAVLNAPMMEKWVPPEGVESVAIFGDNDLNHRGQKAAEMLANHLITQRKINATTNWPGNPGTDYNDQLFRGGVSYGDKERAA